MPFTFSHPAIILPFNFLKKRWISLTALIAGSISPDMEYFIRMVDYSEYSHTWAGLFWFDLPVAFFLTIIYHGIIKRPVIDHLPAGLKRRLWRYRDFSWKACVSQKWLIVIVSLLAGAVSHLLWDLFTHKTLHLVAQVSPINDLLRISRHHKLTYFLLWNFSSLAGGIFIIASISQLPVYKGDIASKNSLLYWSCIFLSTLIIFFIWLYLSADPSFPNCTVSLITSFIIAVIFVSFIYKYFPGKFAPGNNK